MESEIENSIERIRYLQNVHTLPLNDNFNYEGWLENFKEEKDKKIAVAILDFFQYFPNNMVEQMLRTSVGNAGYKIYKKNRHWQHNYFKEKCIFSFIPGENPSPTDSGNYFTRRLRDGLGIPEERIIDYFEIEERLGVEGFDTPIILVDDFVGSGAQIDKAWNENKVTDNGSTLGEFVKKEKLDLVYAPLIINQLGFDRITTYCEGLILSPCHVLNEEYNLFSKKCLCWKQDEKLYEQGTKLILEQSEEIGVPFSNGNHPQDVKGFGEQGLALAFEHGAPDAIAAFFYWQSDNWTPLIKKHYVR